MTRRSDLQRLVIIEGEQGEGGIGGKGEGGRSRAGEGVSPVPVKIAERASVCA